MKQLILFVTFIVAHSSMLAGCDRASSDVQQAQKQKQQEEADKRALRGEFKKSQGKSY
jgi:outer membrane murein-binding lipoprotein Lpp